MAVQDHLEHGLLREFERRLLFHLRLKPNWEITPAYLVKVYRDELQRRAAYRRKLFGKAFYDPLKLFSYTEREIFEQYLEFFEETDLDALRAAIEGVTIDTTPSGGFPEGWGCLNGWQIVQLIALDDERPPAGPLEPAA